MNRKKKSVTLHANAFSNLWVASRIIYTNVINKGTFVDFYATDEQIEELHVHLKKHQIKCVNRECGMWRKDIRDEY